MNTNIPPERDGGMKERESRKKSSSKLIREFKKSD